MQGLYTTHQTAELIRLLNAIAAGQAVTKLVTLLVAVGVCITAGGFLLWSANFGDAADNLTTQHGAEVTIAVAPPPQPPPSTVPAVESTASLPAVPSIPQRAPAISRIEPADDAIQRTEPTSIGEAGVIQVVARPSLVLAGPSSSAPALYGFPAGRPLRVIDHHAGFAQIKDLKSGASGWIDETALASTTMTATVDPKPPVKRNRQSTDTVEPEPKSAQHNTQAVAETGAPATPVSTQKRERRGLSGSQKRADGRDSGFPGFLQRVFGSR